MFAHGHPYNSLLSDLNLPPLDRLDNRLIEVIPNGPHLPRRTAVDTAVVPPLTTNGEPRRQNGTCTGAALNQARRRKKHTYRTHTRREVPTLGLGHRTWRTLQPQSSLFPPRTCTSTGPPCPLTHTGNHRTGWSLVRTSCGCVTHFFLQQARSPTIWQPTTTSMGTPPSLATSSATPPRHPHQPLG